VASRLLLDRREFLTSSAAGIALASFPGCGSLAIPPTAADLTAALGSGKTWGRSFVARIPIADLTSLLAAVSDGGALRFAHPGIHFARLVVLRGDKHLMLEVIHDYAKRGALDYLVGNAAKLDAVFQCCQGYPALAAFQRKSLGDFLRPHRQRADFFYRSYRWSEDTIEASLRLRDHFLKLLRGWELGEAPLPQLWAQFVAEIQQSPQPSPLAAPALNPVFAPHATNTLNMVHAIKPGKLKLADLENCYESGKVNALASAHAENGEIEYRLLFRLLLASGFVQDAAEQDPLNGLFTLHFAHVSVIDDATTEPKMLFASVYDGDFLQYVLDFGTRAACFVDLIWGLTVGYPKTCRDLCEFVKWLDAGQTRARAFHIGHPPATRLEIRAATKLRPGVLAFVDSNPASADLPDVLRALVKENQEWLA
jgi:hypothetical protein